MFEKRVVLGRFVYLRKDTDSEFKGFMSRSWPGVEAVVRDYINGQNRDQAEVCDGSIGFRGVMAVVQANDTVTHNFTTAIISSKELSEDVLNEFTSTEFLVMSNSLSGIDQERSVALFAGNKRTQCGCKMRCDEPGLRVVQRVMVDLFGYEPSDYLEDHLSKMLVVTENTKGGVYISHIRFYDEPVCLYCSDPDSKKMSFLCAQIHQMNLLNKATRVGFEDAVDAVVVFSDWERDSYAGDSVLPVIFKNNRDVHRFSEDDFKLLLLYQWSGDSQKVVTSILGLSPGAINAASNRFKLAIRCNFGTVFRSRCNKVINISAEKGAGLREKILRLRHRTLINEMRDIVKDYLSKKWKKDDEDE
ncbi:hypothetical protein BOW53_00595 [Solemya pervernicosa gill symbiont]|uniref:Uncharacterized protein n=1 Tax=Solemya pervernicosa gill symbiont TaxID=642797 RepID=A0A1T2LB78_9GAMM|nr:hypothetical protein [Solemya pervernicosa gill symbiont]OOZ42368.1 hypothetical protein BOW53_00595 [Solemya pervernicosa gill symbiont]